MSPAAIFIALVVVGASVSVLGKEYGGYMKYAFHNWKRSFQVFDLTVKKLREDGYDMEKLQSYTVSALAQGEKCYNDNMKTYPEHAEAVKAEFKAGVATFPEENWYPAMVENVIDEIFKKENDTNKAMTILSAALGKAVICFRDELQRQMSEVLVDDPETAIKEKKYSNLYQCANHIYQGMWRSFTGPCNDDSKRFWELCKTYQYCKKFEVNKA